jgi:hypothetical protein
MFHLHQLIRIKMLSCKSVKVLYENDPKAQIAQIVHLMEKTNFLTSVQLAAQKIGRLSLVKRLTSS